MPRKACWTSSPARPCRENKTPWCGTGLRSAFLRGKPAAKIDSRAGNPKGVVVLLCPGRRQARPAGLPLSSASGPGSELCDWRILFARSGPARSSQAGGPYPVVNKLTIKRFDAS
jgi:hypothetical protein